MKFGLHVTNFDPAGGTTGLRQALKDVAQFTDENGFYSLSVMDHFFQVGMIGPPEMNMLEAYTTLSYFAAITERIKLLAMVTGIVYRYPGILGKTINTLDVLAGGRTYLGIGAAWNEREALGLGAPFPPLSERFERLEEALQIIRQMWADEVKPYQGKHYQLAEPLSHPLPVSKPHPPILIGGSGEKKTLRLVAQYADACNLFLNPDVAAMRHKVDVLKQHCEDVGRDFKEIEITGTGRIQPGMLPDEIITLCRLAGEAEISHVMFIVPDVYDLDYLGTLVREVVPAVEGF